MHKVIFLYINLAKSIVIFVAENIYNKHRINDNNEN